MRRFFLGGFVCALAVALLGPTALAAESADDCVAIQRTEQADGLDFQLKNNCDRPLACTLAWTLSCENDKGKVTTTAKQSASVAMAKDTDKHVFGSATTCKTSGWRIDDVGWTCAPAGK
jgi:hypothetical protein